MEVRKNRAESFRPPAILSEKIQKSNVPSLGRKIQTRESTPSVNGVFASKPSKSQRSPSPSFNSSGRPQTPSFLQRSQSAERRRPTTPNRISTSPSPAKSRNSTISSPSSKSSTPVRDITEEHPGFFPSQRGLWPSMRSLSASFQGESLSGYLRKGDKQLSISIPTHNQMFSSSSTQKPERRRSPFNGRNTGNQSENLRPSENSHSRIVDQSQRPSSRNGKISSKFMSTSVDLTDKSSRLTSSSMRKAKPRDEVEDPITRVQVKSLENDSSLTRPRRTASLPSISSKVSSPSPFSRSMASPSRSRPSTPSVNRTSGVSRSPGSTVSPRPLTPSFSSSGQNGVSLGKFSMTEIRKGKRSTVHFEASHQLGLLYNRNLQWCLVNAKAVGLMSSQKLTAEKILHGVAITISEMRQSVIHKRISMERLNLEMKLGLFLREQMIYLEEWGMLDMDHFYSLSEVSEALKASIIRLPATGGAKADVPVLKEAINSALGVMRALCFSIEHLNLRMADKFSAVSELIELASTERTLLCECAELLSFVASLQVQEFSLRTHLMQLKRDSIRLNPVATVGE
ncbi:QWRF motif-containing protein 4-like [Wolffia australiana]